MDNKWIEEKQEEFNREFRLLISEEIRLYVNFFLSSKLKEAGKRAVEEGIDKLRLILPLAKGYAYVHDVGSNQKYIEEAERYIAEALKSFGIGEEDNEKK
jgi:hypothetical protein